MTVKRRWLLAPLCLALLLLAGCGAGTPARDRDGAPWGEDWITLGLALGVEPPGHGLTLRDNKAAQGMYYAAWSYGEAQPYTNASGTETNLYDAQLVLLLDDAGAPAAAQATVEEWLALAGENYAVTDTAQQTYNGQAFTVLTYTFASGTSPFARGVSAFTVFGGRAVSAELACRDAFPGDAGAILADVLSRCHYAPEAS